MKIACIIQARMGSTRLPSKVLWPIAGKTILEHVIRGCQLSDVDSVSVATSTASADHAIIRLCRSLKVPVYAGSEKDVLGRYLQAARHLALEREDGVVRVTADCPLIDPQVINAVVKCFRDGLGEYVAIAIDQLKPSFPDGLDCECFYMDLLRRAVRQARLPYDQEHVTSWMQREAHSFTLYSQSGQHRHRKWSVDTLEDYLHVRSILVCVEEMRQRKQLQGEPGLSLLSAIEDAMARPMIATLSSFAFTGESSS